MRTFTRLISLTVSTLVVLAPALVLGDTGNGFVQLATLPSSGPLSQLYSANGDFSSFVNSLFKFAIAFGAIAAVLRLAYAGYLYMGQDMWSAKGKAKEIIKDVVLGVLLLLGVWLILNQINPDILRLNALQHITQPGPQESASAKPATVFATPDNSSAPNDAPCSITINGQAFSGLFQDGTCRFAPSTPAGTNYSNGAIRNQTGSPVN